MESGEFTICLSCVLRQNGLSESNETRFVFPRSGRESRGRCEEADDGNCEFKKGRGVTSALGESRRSTRAGWEIGEDNRAV